MKYIVKSRELEWVPKHFRGESEPSGDFKALWKEHQTKQFEVRITRIPPMGTNTKYHTHTREEEWFYVLSGECHICIEGDWSRIEKGDSVYKPPGAYHIFRNFSHNDCEMIMLGTNVEGSEVLRKEEPEAPHGIGRI